jgi:adenylate kinase family enzyme
MADGETPIDQALSELVDRWCDRRDLRSLRIILDGWPRVSGLTDEWGRLMEALRNLRADRHLPAEEQAVVERLVGEVERVVYRS